MTEEQSTSTEATEWDVLNVQPSANWREGQKKKRLKKSVPQSIRNLFGVLASVARRPDFTTTDLTALVEREAPKWLLKIAVDNLRGQGHSWSEVARAMGVTKAAVIERFGTER